ncbi:preprotein translocase, SecE subunit domain protein [Vagococcus xieshaowenii]|uniref:Preprotein translocase, SecE subunit domain protein n=1 Tax=Vagococcus xieshaowenii TaxID=2562451 RepID=A0AAJ5EG21_9ENTE|nr:preprotein translocase, SecE subunit domain protein [Vagococcus xieshaowenii]QCA29221.1 preprotein translocase, SecE subunit domain protein [Vagococcus xieshaowenii]TFZ43266.1 preprotein translocase, SecE subunit domain protein [Vagococcus xieshaowenii]
MALKGGRIFQEIIEVPDEEEGCGCITWVIIIGIIIAAVMYALEFLFQHPLLFGSLIVGSVVLIILALVGK